MSKKKENHKEKYDINNCFLVDLENVHYTGLDGIIKLGKKDCVRIYYSDSCKSISIDNHISICRSKAEFDYIRVGFRMKNALDCTLLYDLQRINSEKNIRNFFIVSKDRDFDQPIDMMNSEGINVRKIESILCYDLPESDEPDETGKSEEADAAGDDGSVETVPADNNDIEIFFDRYLHNYNDRRNVIITALKDSGSRYILNNELQKYYTSKVVKEIMKTVKPLTDKIY